VWSPDLAPLWSSFFMPVPFDLDRGLDHVGGSDQFRRDLTRQARRERTNGIRVTVNEGDDAHAAAIGPLRAVDQHADAFRRLWGVIRSHPDLAARVRRHSQMIGAEYVELDTGARIAFSTRSASVGRGLSLDRLVVDEAEDLPAAEVGALAPTVFSRPRAQSLYFGTAPGPIHDSEAFATMRSSAHDGLNPRLAWWEWGANVDDQELWVRVNPAVATGRVPLQAIVDDRAILPTDQFRAKRLSMWLPKAAGTMLFGVDQWESLTDLGSVPLVDLAIGVDAAPSRDAATVCVAGRRADGRLHVEWYTTEPGVTWLPGWVDTHLTDVVRAVVIDERGALTELDWAGSKIRPTVTDHRAWRSLLAFSGMR
jgi:hypothetical protein